jgi:hypothetical protein
MEGAGKAQKSPCFSDQSIGILLSLIFSPYVSPFPSSALKLVMLHPLTRKKLSLTTRLQGVNHQLTTHSGYSLPVLVMSWWLYLQYQIEIGSGKAC